MAVSLVDAIPTVTFVWNSGDHTVLDDRISKPGKRGLDRMRNRTGPTLLIADDDRKDVQAIVNVVSGLGCGFITATTGATAWREFSRSRFDLVVADLNMPGGDGGVLARRVRNRSTTPVVLLSELGPVSLEICGLDGLAGIEVVPKPLVSAGLRDAIERQLQLVLTPGQPLTPPGEAA